MVQYGEWDSPSKLQYSGTILLPVNLCGFITVFEELNVLVLLKNPVALLTGLTWFDTFHSML